MLVSGWETFLKFHGKFTLIPSRRRSQEYLNFDERMEFNEGLSPPTFLVWKVYACKTYVEDVEGF